MLLQQGPSRTNEIDRRLACTLASVAGALNAAAFYAVGFFSANMTGNVSSLSDHIALAQWGPAAFYSLIIVVFIMGSTSSTMLITTGRRRGYRGIYALTILVESLLLVGLGTALLWLSSPWRQTCITLGLAFLMGLQNAVVTRISDARVRTTHISGMATDIGIELALLFDGYGYDGLDKQASGARNRLRLHLQTILSFLIGGVAGVVLYRVSGDAVFWMAALTLASIALPFLWMAYRFPTDEKIVGKPLPNDL